MTPTASDVASLSKSVSRWEIAEYVCAAFVTIACAGEYVADFTNWFTGGMKERKERLAKRSTLLLIVALSLELICLVRNKALSEMLIGTLSDKAEKADSKAQSATEKSSLADEKANAAKTNSSTALSQAKDALNRAGAAERSLGRAEDEAKTAQSAASNALTLARGARQEADSFEQDIRLAREAAAKAEEKLADRTLTDKQVSSIAQKLIVFRGQEYTVTTYWESEESLKFADRIHTALQVAQWSYFDEGSKSRMLGGVIGVFVGFHPDADEQTKKAATALADALSQEGFRAVLRPQNPTNNPKHNKIWMNIGTKR